MTWAQLRVLYLQAVGNDASSREEDWTHLSEGHRDIGLLVDLPEVNLQEDAVISSGNDFLFVSSLTPLFAILDMSNITEGTPMYPEPGGMTGRRRYLTNTGQPATGSVTHYQRDTDRIWVRSTPTAATTIRIRMQRHLSDISDADLNDQPIVPPQYHMAIVYAAAEKYFLLHPKIDMAGDIPVSKSETFKSAKVEAVTSRKAAVVEEDRARVETMRLRGYRLGVRSRGTR